MKEVIVYLTLIVILASHLALSVFELRSGEEFYSAWKVHSTAVDGRFEGATIMLCRTSIDVPGSVLCEVYEENE
jgi:hypothetical protein